MFITPFKIALLKTELPAYLILLTGFCLLDFAYWILFAFCLNVSV